MLFGLTMENEDVDQCQPGLFTYFWFCLTNKYFIHAVSGGLGSVFAITVFYPLDIARTRLQVDDKQKAHFSFRVIADIVREEGIFALYSGWLSIVVALYSTNFVYFFVFHGSKSLLQDWECPQDACTDLFVGSVAGVIAVLLTNPLWVVNTRLKLQSAKMKADSKEEWKRNKYNGIIDCLFSVIQYEGVPSLWSGTLPSLVLVANPAIHFMSYETLKRNVIFHLGTKELSSFIYFIIGAISKFIATVLTYPMQVVQSRLRFGSPSNQQGGGVFKCIQEIISLHGLWGLFRGLESKLLQTVLTAALMFLTYEKISSTVFHLLNQDVDKL